MKKHLYISILSTASIMAHGGVIHDGKSTTEKITNSNTASKYRKINKLYIAGIKPIFEKKCFICHASKPSNLPWYYSLPGVKQLIDYDMNTAKKHMDFRKNFPFISHGSPLLDLKSLQETVIEGEMPPLRYKIMHWDSGLTDREAQKVKAWTAKGIEILSSDK